MCGITGYITKQPSDTLARVAKALLIANQDRGEASAGIYTSSNGSITKKAVSPINFINTIDTTELAKSKIVIGHTRLPTTGATTDQNAHPFRFGNIVGVHNGIVYNYKDVYSQANVDSEAIFHKLNKTENSFKKTFKKLSGLFAIAWTDGRGNLYLVRDGEPLTVAIVDDTIFFNSELLPLVAVLYATYGKIDKVESITEDTVIKIDENLQMETTFIKFKDHIVTGYNGHNAYRTYYPQYNDGFATCDVCGGEIDTETFYIDEDWNYVYCKACAYSLPDKVYEKLLEQKTSDYFDIETQPIEKESKTK